MEAINAVPWLVLVVVGLIGSGLFWAGLKLSQSQMSEKKDALGVKYSERALFLLLNGTFLVLIAAVVATIKMIN